MRQSLLGIVAFIGLVLTGSGAFAADPDEVLGEMAMGSPDAPVTIQEHSSMTCGHCGNFHREILPKIKEAYIDTGKARLVFRDFPLDPLALAVSMLPHCAGPDKYFGFQDVLFRGQDTWINAEDRAAALIRMVRVGGMSESDFQACLDREDLSNAIIERREADAERFDIDSTPTFFINGEKLVGARPFEEFAEAIDRALEEAQ